MNIWQLLVACDDLSLPPRDLEAHRNAARHRFPHVSLVHPGMGGKFSVSASGVTVVFSGARHWLAVLVLATLVDKAPEDVQARATLALATGEVQVLP